MIKEYEAAVAHEPADPDDDTGSQDDRSRVSLRRADLAPRLFEYQTDLARQFEAVCTREPPDNVALLTLPTGAGKTRTAVVALLRLLRAPQGRTVLWLAPTRELLAQAMRTAETAWRDDGNAADMELVRADLAGRLTLRLDRGIVFSTPQMVAARLKKGVVPDADIVVFDEAHHVEAPLFRATLERFRGDRGAAIIGLSATPGRSDEEETERLVDFFQGRLLWSEQLTPDAVTALQRRGVLARVAFRDIPVPPESLLPKASTTSRHLSFDVDRFRGILKVVSKASQDSRVLVFAATVAHAHAIAAALRVGGVSAMVVSSYDSDEHRRNALEDFERGRLPVLLNKSLLATGYDCPAIRHVVLATPIRSAILFEQIVGRASRGSRVGGSTRSTVWQFGEDDHLRMHGLPQSYHRYEDYDWKNLRRAAASRHART